nr:zinc finger, CCHC-type [Tanacetum cinerariifolium]
MNVFASRDDDDRTNGKLYEALSKGEDMEAAREMLLRAPSLLTMTNKIGETPLFHAARYGFNESGGYKKTFIGSGVGTSLMQVLHGFEFEVEPLGDHTFEVEPQENIDQGAGLQKVQTQDLIDYQLARDRKQHLACELFEYREDNNEDAFEVAAVEKIYEHESFTFNNIVVCEVISKWKAGLKDDMDARSDVYVLSNGSRKCSDDIDGYYWKYTMDQSGNTLRVSQSRIHNEKLVQTLLKGHSTLSLEDSLSMDRYVKNMIRDKRTGSLKANLQHMEALLTTEVGYVTFTEA